MLKFVRQKYFLMGGKKLIKNKLKEMQTAGAGNAALTDCGKQIKNPCRILTGF